MNALREVPSYVLTASVIVLAFSLGVTTPEAESIALRTTELAGSAVLGLLRLATHTLFIR